MIKQFSRMELAAIKRSMKNVAPLTKKRASLEKAADKVLEELKAVDAQIAAYKQLMDPFTYGIDPEIILAQNGQVEIAEQPEIPVEEELSMIEGDNLPFVIEEMEA